MQLFDKAFRRKPGSYIKQSLLAAGVVAIILYFLKFISSGVIIVAALGASSFIVFTMPNTIPAQPRRLIGGHAVGIIIGSVFHYIFITGPLSEITAQYDHLYILAGALVVGLSIFVMTITDTEHPPAATTALGIIIYGWTFQAIILVMVTAVGLALARKLLLPYLKDLF